MSVLGGMVRESGFSECVVWMYSMVSTDVHCSVYVFATQSARLRLSQRHHHPSLISSAEVFRALAAQWLRLAGAGEPGGTRKGNASLFRRARNFIGEGKGWRFGAQTDGEQPWEWRLAARGGAVGSSLKRLCLCVFAGRGVCGSEMRFRRVMMVEALWRRLVMVSTTRTGVVVVEKRKLAEDKGILIGL